MLISESRLKSSAIIAELTIAEISAIFQTKRFELTHAYNSYSSVLPITNCLMSDEYLFIYAF